MQADRGRKEAGKELDGEPEKEETIEKRCCRQLLGWDEFGEYQGSTLIHQKAALVTTSLSTINITYVLI